MSKAQHTPEHKCCGRVWNKFRFLPCGRNGKTQDVSGNWYCGIHSPEAQKKRKEKNDAKYAAKKERWDAHFERQKRADICFNACEGISTEALETGVIKELLEALQQMVDDCSTSYVNQLQIPTQASVNKARAAIVKALNG